MEALKGRCIGTKGEALWKKSDHSYFKIKNPLPIAIGIIASLPFCKVANWICTLIRKLFQLKILQAFQKIKFIKL
jgi:hypothetical protein